MLLLELRLACSCVCFKLNIGEFSSQKVHKIKNVMIDAARISLGLVLLDARCKLKTRM